MEYLEEMYRTLAGGGVFLILSHGPPQTRLIYLRQRHFSWRINYTKFGIVYIYLLYSLSCIFITYSFGDLRNRKANS